MSTRPLDNGAGKLLLWALKEPRVPLPPVIFSPALSQRLVDAAGLHSVAGLVYDSLYGAGLLQELEPSVRAQLRKLRVLAAAQFMRVAHDLETVANVLDGRGVRWAVIKGPSIAALAYTKPSARWYSDLDVLVEAHNFGGVIDALCSSGCSLMGVDWRCALGLRRSEVKLRLPVGTVLDLHWHPVNDAEIRATTNFDVEAMLARRRVITGAQGPVMPVLDPVDNMLVVAQHAVLSGGHKLVWAKDLECLARRDPPDWAQLVRRASTTGTELQVAVMLKRSARLLDTPVPAQALAQLLRSAQRTRATLVMLGERFATPASMGRGSRTGMTMMLSMHRSTVASGSDILSGALRHLLPGRERPEQRAWDHKLAGEGITSQAAARSMYLSSVSDHSLDGRTSSVAAR